MRAPKVPCRTYWASHGCDRRRGHEGDHVCDCQERQGPDFPHLFGEDVDGEVLIPPIVAAREAQNLRTIRALAKINP